MKLKNEYLTIGILVIIIVFGTILMATTEVKQTENTGGEAVRDVTWISCEDNDVPPDPYFAGTVTATYMLYGRPVEVTKKDNCDIETVIGPTLTEWYCDRNEPKSELIYCKEEEVCEDGACVSLNSCNDTDGGLIYDIYGVASGYENGVYKNYPDECETDGTEVLLLEGYCTEENYPYIEKHECEFGCEAGICKDCMDECSPNGEQICANNQNYLVCGYFDDDACLEWSEPYTCEAGTECIDGECVTIPPPYGLACGDILTENTVMTADLLNCPGVGLYIGASGITLDCDSHIIEGSGEHSGIYPYLDLFEGVTIKNCEIRNFASGISSLNANVGFINSIFKNNNIHNVRHGIDFWYTSNGNSILDNTIAPDRTNSISGISLIQPTNDVIKGNTVNGNSLNIYYGIHSSEGEGVTIQDNTATGFSIGFALSSINMLVEDNFAYNNQKGFMLTSANGSQVSDNTACNSSEVDFRKNSLFTFYPSNNMCDTTHNWNDQGTNGCTYACSTTGNCTDFDGGMYPTIPSSVTDAGGNVLDGCSYQGNAIWKQYEQTCVNGERVSITNYCPPAGCIYNVYPTGAGMCLNATNSTMCVDSDGGANFNFQGMAHRIYQGTYAISQIDFCLSSTLLQEVICTGTYIDTVETTCPNGCSSGKCN